MTPFWPTDPFLAYFRAATGPPEAHIPLVRFIYRQSPSAGLDVLRRTWNRDVELDRKLLWAEHVVTDYLWKFKNGFATPADEAAADSQLIKLAEAEQFWVRLYVAESLRQDGELRRRHPALFAKMQSDQNELVRDAALHPVVPEDLEKYRVGGKSQAEH